MRFFFLLIVGCAVLSFPVTVFAAVIFNEIAWMGTAASSANEWIELKNTSTTAVTITGWKLIADDGTPSITLSGIIPSGGYFLLERTDDSTVPEVKADGVYVGSLSNAGEILRLEDEHGIVVDRVDGGSGWPAGSVGTKETMQRSGMSWVTGAPTPRAENITTVVSPASSAQAPSHTKGSTVAPPTDRGKIKAETQESVLVPPTADNAATQKEPPSKRAEEGQIMNINLLWLFGSLVAGLLVGFLALTYQSFRRPVL